MGIAQQSMQGLAGTVLAAGAAVGKIGADIDKANVAKAEEADSLQEEFLKNKDAIALNNEDIKKLEPIANAGNSGPAHRAGYTDKQAAQIALQNLKDKNEALVGMQDRISTRFTKLTRTPIIGGNK